MGALAYITLILLADVVLKKKVGVVKADVSGAFDRVPRQRFLGKLQSYGIPGNIFKLIASWLSARCA